MAYLNYLVAVTPNEVEAFRRDSTYRMAAREVVGVSHLLSHPGWVRVEPLVSIFAEILDGGQDVNDALWHPFRVPLYHPPQSVRVLLPQLANAWGNVLSTHELPDDDWLRLEVERAIKLLEVAVQGGDGIMSILEPPHDQERAVRVVNPLQRELW